jgi:hypothetical protein
MSSVVFNKEKSFLAVDYTVSSLIQLLDQTLFFDASGSLLQNLKKRKYKMLVSQCCS